jgi:hypothetical protein
MTRILTIALVALGAAAGAASAAGKPGANAVTGPFTLSGPGIVRGALMSSGATDPVTFTLGGARGGIAFVDRGGDLKVDCKAEGGLISKTRKNGKTALVCKGDATATGSKFAFAARGPKFQLTVPAGYKGRARHVDPRTRGARKHGQAGAPTTPTNTDDQAVAAAEQALADAVAAGDS